jgi:PmbA protein
MRALLSAYCSVFSGKQALLGLSLLSGKVGETVAADCVTLVDDAMYEGGYVKTAFDGEGVATYKKNVIEKGVLKTLLYNRKTAKKDGVASTGNGFKAGLTGSVKTATTNFYLAKGGISQEKLFSQMGDGLFITSLMGLHSGCNAVSGDFSLSAEGFCVEGGKLGQPVEQITIAGNFYHLLEAVEEIADDLYFGSAGIGSPSVLVRNLDIAGN